MSFIADGKYTVYWVTSGGSYRLKAHEIECLLGIFDREHDVRAWLELDSAAQAAGYPAALSSIKGAA